MKKSQHILLRVAGSISLLFAIFHMLFFKIFNWAETLACLDKSNWAIFQTLNLGGIMMVVMIAYFSLFKANDLISNRLSLPLLVFFSLFYLIRIVAEFLFFGFSGVESIVIILLCLIPMISFMIVLRMKNKEE